MDHDGQFEWSNVVHIKRPQEQSDWVVHPNPTNGLISITTTHAHDRFELFDMRGRVVKAGNFHGSVSRIDLGEQSAGMYMLKVFDKDELVLTEKIIKK